MKARSLLVFGSCLLGWLMFAAVSAQAQSTKIFVASFGNDANNGSRGSPKRNFQPAHDAVAAGGEVVALDTASYGALVITKSVGITTPAGITGFITTTGGTNGITVNAGASDKVSLRGLTINAVNTTGTPRGILLNVAATLTVDACTVSGYNNGIRCEPSVDTALVLTNSTLRGNTAAGFIAAFAAANNVRATIDRCALVSNGAEGIIVSGTTTAGASQRVEVCHSLIANNKTSGVFTAGSNAFTLLQGCTVSANDRGINVQTGAVAKVDGCAITANTTLGIQVSGTGASLLSRGNNTLEDNGADGTFSGSYSAK